MVNVNKMTDLIQEYNLAQLIREHTHFTEHSSSMIDLILVRSNAHVLTSGVIDIFIPDHCPTIVLLKFLRPAMKTYSRIINSQTLTNLGNYCMIITL